MPAFTGRVGDGVLGPLEDAADVKEDCEPPWELTDDAMLLTRGDEVPDEYVCWDCGNGKDGNLSPLIYNGR